MTRRITRLNVSGLGLIAWALLLGVLCGRAELFLAAVPLLVALVSGALRSTSPRYALTHEVSASRLYEGDRLTVTLTLTGGSALPQVELLEPLPPSIELLSGSNRRVFTLVEGQTARWSYELRFPGRTRVMLGTVHLRIWEPSGLGVIEAEYRDPKPVHVYPGAAALRRLPVPLRTQTSVGNYVSPLVGEGLEPGEIRPFAPGDRVKHVNWRASLRLGRLYVTRHQQERNADVVLMLDTLSQVGTAPATTLDASTRAAAALALGYLSRKDRVGLVEYGGVFRWVKPASGRVQFERLLDALLRAEATFTYVAKDLALVPPRILPPQALVIGLSPLVDRRFVEAVSDLAARGFDVIVLAVDPVALTRAALPASLLVDSACRLWALERGIQLDELRRQGLRVLEWRPDEPLELALVRIGPRRRPRAVAG